MEHWFTGLTLNLQNLRLYKYQNGPSFHSHIGLRGGGWYCPHRCEMPDNKQMSNALNIVEKERGGALSKKVTRIF